MKLWHCTCEAYGQTPYGFYVTETEADALAKYKEELKWQGIDYYEVSANAVESVDGYAVEILKK